MSGSTQSYIFRKLRLTFNNVTKENLESSKFSLSTHNIAIDFDDIKTHWNATLSHTTKKEDSDDDEGKKIKYLTLQLYPLSFSDSANFQHSLTIALQDVKVQKFHMRISNPYDWFEPIKLMPLKKFLDPAKPYFGSDSKVEMVLDIALLPDDDQDSVPQKRTYSQFYEDSTFTDFTLIPSDEKKEFKVHRTVLAFESEFFMKLFTTDMKEKQNGTVKFVDIDKEAMEEVIKYIYKGKADLEDIEDASKILNAAEKFNLPGLKLMCIEFLEKEVCIENAIEILSIAELFSIQRLEDICLHTIIENFDAMKDTEGWKTITTPVHIKIMNAFNVAYTSNIPHHVSTSC